MSITIPYPTWFEPGKLVVLAILIYMVGLTFVFLRKAKTKPPKIRKLAAIDALPELVGRAAEMQKSVIYAMGAAGGIEAPSGQFASEFIASYSIMSEVCHLTAKMRAPFIHIFMHPALMPVASDVVETAYKAEGKMEDYKPLDMVRYGAPTSYSMAAYIVDVMEREKVATTFFVGPWYSEILMCLETANRLGAMQISGSSRLTQLPWMVIIADYSLIGEEVFAAGAYISEDPSLLGTIWAQDFGKFMGVGVLVVGFLVLLAANSKIIVDILKL